MASRHLDRVLTLRLPARAARRLTEHARSVGKTPSAVVRDLLARELGAGDDDATLIERTRRFVGAIRDERVSHGRDARSALKKWSPDRRG